LAAAAIPNAVTIAAVVDGSGTGTYSTNSAGRCDWVVLALVE